RVPARGQQVADSLCGRAALGKAGVDEAKSRAAHRRRLQCERDERLGQLRGATPGIGDSARCVEGDDFAGNNAVPAGLWRRVEGETVSDTGLEVIGHEPASKRLTLGQRAPNPRDGVWIDQLKLDAVVRAVLAHVASSSR